MSLEHRSGTPFDDVPAKRKQEYQQWLTDLGHRHPDAEADIRCAVNAWIDQWLLDHQAKPGAAFSSSWIPGPDWNVGSGVYESIYSTMMDLYGNHGIAHTRAGWFFGLIVMETMIYRADHWECWHERHDPGEDPLGMFYRPANRAAV